MPDLPTGLHVVAAGFLLRAVLRRPLRARAAGGPSACSVILAGAAGLAPVPGGASRQDERQGGVHEQLSLPPPSFPPGPGERRGDRVRERAGGLGFDGATELKEATLFVLFCRAGLNLILELIKPWTWLERGGVGPWVGGPQQRGDIASGVLRPSQPSREATRALEVGEAELSALRNDRVRGWRRGLRQAWRLAEDACIGCLLGSVGTECERG